MAELKDRIPTQPNRKKITPENGSAYYAAVEYADNPVESGTPVNKKNVLDTIYPESTDNSIGVQIMKIGEVEDDRWIECDGRYISKTDYALLYNKLAEANGIFDLLRDVRSNPPVPEYADLNSILYIKNSDCVFFGGYASDFTGTYGYFSNDGGQTWTPSSITSTMVRYGAGSNGGFYMWNDGKILIADAYSDSYYYSADGISFTSGSGSSGMSKRPACNSNGFVFDSYYKSGTYGAKYSVNYGQTFSTYTNKTIFGKERTFPSIPNKTGALMKSPVTNLYYYIDSTLTPLQIETSHELINSTSQVDDNYNIYTIDSSYNLCVYNGNDYSLTKSISLLNVVETISAADIVVLAGVNVYVEINGALYIVYNLLHDGSAAKVEFAAGDGWKPSGGQDFVWYDRENMIYTGHNYHIIDTTYVPNPADNSAANKWYIKAK